MYVDREIYRWYDFEDGGRRRCSGKVRVGVRVRVGVTVTLDPTQVTAIESNQDLVITYDDGAKVAMPESELLSIVKTMKKDFALEAATAKRKRERVVSAQLRKQRKGSAAHVSPRKRDAVTGTGGKRKRSRRHTHL